MEKQIKIVLLILVIFLARTSSAQINKLDSLENLLKIHKTDDTVKVNLLNEIAYLVYTSDNNKTRSYATQSGELADKLMFLKGKAESTWLIGVSYVRQDNDKAFDYYQSAMKISNDIKDKALTIKCLNGIGAIYRLKGENSKSIEFCQKAIKIAEEANNRLELAKCFINLSKYKSEQGDYSEAIDGFNKALIILKELNEKALITTCLNELGIIYRNQGNYPLAIEYFQSNLKMSEELDRKQGVFLGLSNIGSTYIALSDYPKALEYYQKSLKIAEEIKDKVRITYALRSIGEIYMKTNNKQAIEYLQKALTIGEETNYIPTIINISISVGDFYLQNGNFEKAMTSYLKALKKSEETERKSLMCQLMHKIGGIYFKQKKYELALNSTLKGLELANEMKLMDEKSKLHKQLSEIYEANSDYKRAHLHNKLFTQLNDSIYNKKNIQKIAELEYTYKFDKEKHAIELEQQKKNVIQASEKKVQWIIICSLIMGFLLVSSFAGYVYRSSQIKQKTNLLLSKQKDKIEELNEEYRAINEELMTTNEALVETKKLVEESEERLKLLIKNSNDILVLVNEKGEQHFISDVAKSLTGYEVEDLLGSVEDVIVPDDLDIVRQHWERVIVNKDLADCIQYRHKHKEKGYVWFEAVAQNFLDHPAIKSVVANVRDITERKNAELALQESEAIKAQLLANEIERMNREIESNQRSMTAATLKLIQNSERDAQTIDRLMEIEKTANPEEKQKIKALISDNKRLSYNSNWDEFEILFEKVHHSFYEKLNAQFPTLTANERKMCAFLKLNMSNKDIAQITFQSDDALKKARLRLRQKLEIDRETNLVCFLQNI